MEIGEQLKEYRTKSGKTLRLVESATGISNAYLSQLENGKIINPAFITVYKLCCFYGIKTTDITIN